MDSIGSESIIPVAVSLLVGVVGWAIRKVLFLDAQIVAINVQLIALEKARDERMEAQRTRHLEIVARLASIEQFLRGTE